MKSVFYALGLALVFALAEQVTAPNFEGTWTLDKNKSQGLPQSHKSFEQISWVITQNEKEIAIDEKLIGFAVAGLPPARPGRGGGIQQPTGPRTYSLDGRETIQETATSKYARKAILSDDGKTLELIEKITSKGTDGRVTATSNNKLSLSPDGKVLTVIRHREGWGGPPDSTLVFNK